MNTMNTFKSKFAFAFLSPFSGETIKRTFTYLLAASITAILTTSASADIRTWNNSAIDFNLAASWVPSVVPNVAGDVALFNAGTPSFQPQVSIDIGNNIAFDFATGGWNFTSSVPATQHVIQIANSTDAGGNSLRIAAGATVTFTDISLRQQTNGIWSLGNNSLLVFDRYLNTERAPTFDGPGKVVFNGVSTGGRRPFAVSSGATVLVNGTTAAADQPLVSGIVDYTATGTGSTIGGTGIIRGTTNLSNTTNRITIESGAILSPGGDGTYGAEIGTLTFLSYGLNAADFRNSIDMQAGSTLRIDLGSTGISDKMIIDANPDLSLNHDLGVMKLATTGSGVTLDLFGTNIWGTFNGTYTLVEMTNVRNDYYGFFTTVSYNGNTVTNNWSLLYNDKDIVLTVIPEPSTLVLLGLAGITGLVALRRRK